MNRTLLIGLKITGWAILAHVILITLSISEVFVYSLAVNPDQDQKVYEAHAQWSAPYVSILFGIPVFYFAARMLVKTNEHYRRPIAIGLPLIYIIFDLIMLIPYMTDWGSNVWILVVSFSIKILSACLGAKLFRRTQPD